MIGAEEEGEGEVNGRNSFKEPKKKLYSTPGPNLVMWLIHNISSVHRPTHTGWTKVMLMWGLNRLNSRSISMPSMCMYEFKFKLNLIRHPQNLHNQSACINEEVEDQVRNRRSNLLGIFRLRRRRRRRWLVILDRQAGSKDNER